MFSVTYSSAAEHFRSSFSEPKKSFGDGLCRPKEFTIALTQALTRQPRKVQVKSRARFHPDFKLCLEGLGTDLVIICVSIAPIRRHDPFTNTKIHHTYYQNV